MENFLLKNLYTNFVYTHKNEKSRKKKQLNYIFFKLHIYFYVCK